MELEYLLKVLNFNEYKEYPDDENKCLTVYKSKIAKGVLGSYVYDKLSDGSSEENVSIAIIPKWLEKVLIDQKEDSGVVHECFIPITPFYIKTDLNANGELNLDKADVIWATCLEYPDMVDGASFATQEMKTKLNKDNGWDGFMESVQKRFEEHYGIGWNEKKIKDVKGHWHSFTTMKDSYWVMADDSVTGTKRNIITLVKRLRNHPDEINPLLKRMLGDVVTPIDSQPQVGKNLPVHCGQMKNDYPLAEAQRHAIHCMSQLTEGNVLAVSGPPGTGKTTMLQSVVADLIVKHALAGRKPPILLATSSNNKAITNIIDAFKIDKKADGLFTRWIKYKNTPLPLAAYLPSGQAKNKDEFFCTNEKGEGDYDALRGSLDETKDYFLEMARKSNVGKVISIGALKNSLLNELRNTNGMLEKIDRSLKGEDKGLLNRLWKTLLRIGSSSMSEKEIETFLVEQVAECSTDYKSKDEEGKKKFKEKQRWDPNPKPDVHIDFKTYTDQKLDQCLRFKCFWLAVHYYEACWLEIIEEKKSADLAKQIRADIYGEMSYVCPCFVATFFRAPRCFGLNKDANEDRGFLLNFVDLLIVDEAGQACTEIGLPVFALAKKAIVVGDEQQIPPIYTIKTLTSKRYWEEILKDHADDIRTYNLLDCSSSSVMRIASRQSLFNRIWTDGVKLEGLFLDEHRRCYDAIIAYCNKLIYKGRLAALKGSPKEGETVFPVMAHYHVEHQNSEKQPNGSRCSNDEANAIAEWINMNKETILRENKDKDGKEKKLKEVISVITPFKAQAALIKKMLNTVGLKDIPVGTVHTFQGAESNIVIYSTVYGSSEEFSFVNANNELMNVAVSRAKQHFFLFCSKKAPKVYSAKDIEKAPNRPAFDLLLIMTSTPLNRMYE